MHLENRKKKTHAARESCMH